MFRRAFISFAVIRVGPDNPVHYNHEHHDEKYEIVVAHARNRLRYTPTAFSSFSFSYFVPSKDCCDFVAHLFGVQFFVSIHEIRHTGGYHLDALPVCGSPSFQSVDKLQDQPKTNAKSKKDIEPDGPIYNHDTKVRQRDLDVNLFFPKFATPRLRGKAGCRAPATAIRNLSGVSSRPKVRVSANWNHGVFY